MYEVHESKRNLGHSDGIFDFESLIFLSISIFRWLKTAQSLQPDVLVGRDAAYAHNLRG